MRALVLPLVAVVALAACGPSPASSGSGGARPGAAASGQRTLKVGKVTGKVIAPSGWKPGDKAPAEAVAAKKKYDLLEKGEAMANVEVWLGTPKRERFKGPSVATTTAKGEFTITGVPTDLAYVVYTSVVNAKGEVEIKEQPGVIRTPPPPPPPNDFCSLMPQQPANQPPRPVVISFASTVVVNDMFKDLGNQLGKVDWAAFGKMVGAVDAKLDVNALPNLKDPNALGSFLATVQVDGKSYAQAADAFKTVWKSAQIDVNAAQQILNGLPQINVTGSGSVSQGGDTVAAGGGEGTIIVPQGIDLGGLLAGAGLTDPTPAPAATTEPAPAATATPAAATP